MVTATSQDDNNFIEAVMDNYLTQHKVTPTRGRGTNEPSLIDLVFSSNAESIESIELHAPLGKSDYSLIKLMYRTEPEDLPKKIVCDFFKADFQKMKEHLNIDWETLFEECGEDIDSVWNKFINKYIDAERECIPSKTIVWGKSDKKFHDPSFLGAGNIFAEMIPEWVLESRSGVCQTGTLGQFEIMTSSLSYLGKKHISREPLVV